MAGGTSRRAQRKELTLIVGVVGMIRLVFEFAVPPRVRDDTLGSRAPGPGARVGPPGMSLPPLLRPARSLAKGEPPTKIGCFPAAVLVASLFSTAADDTRLRGTLHADMLSLLGHGAAPFPSPRAPPGAARAKEAAADLCGRCAAPPARTPSPLIRPWPLFELPPWAPSPCMSFSLGAPRLSRPQQV